MEVIVAAITAAFLAQVIKYFLYKLQGRTVDFRILVQTGGMPSSHSASMVSMATSVGLIAGFESMVFAVAFGIAMIVMYDAAGLRRAAGRMAGVLNSISEDFYGDHPDRLPERMRELLGHTPFEVIAGAILGMATAYVFHVKMLGG